MDAAVRGCKTKRGSGSTKLIRRVRLLLGRAKKLNRREGICGPWSEAIDRELGWFSRGHFYVEVIVILLGRFTLPILIEWVAVGNLNVGSPGKNWILFRATTTEQQILHAIHIIDLSRVHVSVEYDDVQVFGVRCNGLVGILIFGDRAHARASEGRSVKGDENLLGSVSLGLIQPHF